MCPLPCPHQDTEAYTSLMLWCLSVPSAEILSQLQFLVSPHPEVSLASSRPEGFFSCPGPACLAAAAGLEHTFLQEIHPHVRREGQPGQLTKGRTGYSLLSTSRPDPDEVLNSQLLPLVHCLNLSSVRLSIWLSG